MTGDDVVVESRDGTRLAVSRVGSGSPVVLVHGALLAREAWQFVVPQLAERHTVWSYDRRAHGRSGGGADLSLDRDLEDVAAVVAAAGPDVHLVGHSFGALVGLEAAVDLPELRSLVLYEPTVRFHRCEDVFRRGLELLDRDDLEGFLDLFLTEVAAVSGDEVALLRSIPEGWELLVDAARSYRDHHEAFARSIDELVARGWQPDRYSSVTAPTLLLIGVLTQSALFATADDVRSAVPHAEVGTLDGQRHMAAAFDPAGLADAVLAFTAAHDRPEPRP